MRKQSRLLLPLLVLLLLAGFAGACGGSDSETGDDGSTSTSQESTKPLDGKVVWYMDMAGGNPAFDAVAQGINKPLMEEGATLTRSFAVNTAGQLDISVMAQAFDRAIAAKPAAIVYFVLDPTGLKPQVEKAGDAGIPVFAIVGRPADEVPVNGFLEGDDRAQGKLLAETLAAGMGTEGSQWTVIAAAPTPNVEAMLDSATTTMEAEGMTFVGSRDEQRNLTDVASGGQQVMQGLLQRFPDLKGVFAFNDDTALGAIAAIKAAGKQPGRDIVLVSRNGSPDALAAIEKGDLYATCDIAVVDLGLAMGNAIRDHLTGEQLYDDHMAVAPPSVEGCITTKENLADYVPWDEQLTYVEITER